MGNLRFELAWRRRWRLRHRPAWRGVATLNRLA
jgi:hypothetical protein